MLKHEFITQLKRALAYLPESERLDILEDYEEHFRIGTADGRAEEEIASALGDPRTLGKEFTARLCVRKAEESPSAGGIGRAVLATVGLGLFNLFVVLFPFIFLIMMLGMILVTGFSLMCAGPFLIGYAVLELIGVILVRMPVHPLAGFFFGLGLTCSGLLFMALDAWLTKILYRIGIRYLHWNIAVISGREEI
ncbi:MAG TPA: DUF1700 domain-containing protein [Methanospirillum sp.]|nr:DUF1700 domain-containing protein [Methanospirillum sp.]